MPPDVPQSTKLMPFSFASAYRRCVSRKFELPPSTITSPGDPRSSSVWNVSSVIFPAGTIIQKERGASSWSRSSSKVAPLGADAADDLVERVRELLHALRLERVRHLVVVHADLGQLLEEPLRVV